MNACRKFGYRFYQKTMYVLMAFMPWHTPKVISGAGCLKNVAEEVKKIGLKKPLIVTDKSAVERNAFGSLTSALEKNGILYEVYDNVLPNPTISQIEEGYKKYLSCKCDCIVAFGGGSVMDCAKIIGARAVCPGKSVPRMKGLLKIRKKLPALFAVPTTAGTGSEVTVAAVISDPDRREKYPINDFSLIPRYAVLDPALTLALPPFLTATTGMDALTHAVEAYIGKGNTNTTKRKAYEAVELIFDNLEKAYNCGSDLNAREAMQKAAFLAGEAFTRAYVGYVHALAHALGGMYGVPHGLANAVLLPYVLSAYGKKVEYKLATLSRAAKIDGKTQAEKAEAFITAVKNMNRSLKIPEKLEDYPIKKSDIDTLVLHALKEANPLYPVPVIFGAEELKQIYLSVLVFSA